MSYTLSFYGLNAFLYTLYECIFMQIESSERNQKNNRSPTFAYHFYSIK